MSSLSTSAGKYYTKVFSFATLTSVVSRPTQKSISKFQRKIFACAGSIATTRGSGAHENLGLVMAPTAYKPIAPGTPYLSPVPIGPIVATLLRGAGMTGNKLFKQRLFHNDALAEFHNCNLLKRQLTNLII